MSSSSSPSNISESLQNGILINFAICGLLGASLNALILIVLWKKYKSGKLHTDGKICGIVACTDVLVSLGLIFRSIFVKLPYNIFKVHPNWCKFEATAITQLMNCSGYILGVMSLERFLLICFNLQFSIIFWFSFITVVFFIPLCNSTFCTASNWQDLAITEVSCTVRATPSTCYAGFLVTTTFFLISFSCVIISYLGIMIFKFKQCLNQLNLNIPKETVYAEFRSTFVKSLVYMLLYILVFSGKLYTMAYALITGLKRTILMDVMSQTLLAYSPAVNATILLYMNQDIRVSFIELLVSIKSKFIRQ